MPVVVVRPRRLATGVVMDGDRLLLSDCVLVEGLMVGVYLVYAPWRDPVALPVSADGVVVLPDGAAPRGPNRRSATRRRSMDRDQLAHVAWL